MHSTVRTFAFAGLVLLGGCFRPSPPTVTPRDLEVTGTTDAGITMRVTLALRNINSYDIRLNWVSAHVAINGLDLGVTQYTTATTLPSNQDVVVQSDIAIPWNAVPGLLLATASQESVPYTMDGTANAGARGIYVTTSFRSTGNVPRQFIVDAANRQGQRTVPGTPAVPSIPGLPFPMPGSTAPQQPGTQPTAPTTQPQQPSTMPSIPGMPSLPNIFGPGPQNPQTTH